MRGRKIAVVTTSTMQNNPSETGFPVSFMLSCEAIGGETSQPRMCS